MCGGRVTQVTPRLVEMVGPAPRYRHHHAEEDLMITTYDPISRTRPDTRALLLAGAAAGPLFTASALVQMATRDGFDLRRHALSQLSTGSSGWIQMATFVLTG